MTNKKIQEIQHLCPQCNTPLSPKASDALLKAKLYDDAEYAYSELLRITASDARKRLIRQKLQHIQLLRNAGREATRG